MDASVTVAKMEVLAMNEHRQSQATRQGRLLHRGKAVVRARLTQAVAARPTQASRWLRGGRLLFANQERAASALTRSA
jgi:hypothetical protein